MQIKQLSGILGVVFAVTSASASPVSYLCVEERTVGWEGRENGEDAVGQFQPSNAPMIVKFFPAKFQGANLLELAKIEITEEGKTSTLISNACSTTIGDIIQDRQLGLARDIDWYVRGCALTIKGVQGMIGFGSGAHRVEFTDDLGSRPTPVRYTESLIVGVVWAYVHRGTCTLAQ